MFVSKVISFFFVCILAACGNSVSKIKNAIEPQLSNSSQQTDQKEENKNTFFVKMEITECLGNCPVYVLTIQSDGNFFFENVKFREKCATLGWLIDPKNRRVYVYRANAEVEILQNPQTVSGEDVLKDFELDLTEIW